MTWTKVVASLKEYFLLILTIIFFIASFMYPTPLDQQTLILNTIGLNIPTAVDFPSIFVYFFCFILLISFADSFYINQKAYHSDYVFANGLDTNVSCAGSDLMTVGDWSFIQGEKTKNFPIGGHKFIANPPTHTHRVGTHIVMEGRCVPAPLPFLPNDIKSYGRAMRDGIFGITVCCIGYLSDLELSQYKQYKKSDYEKIKKEFEAENQKSVASLIEITRDKNRALNTKVEFANNEHGSLSDFLKNVQEISNAINKSQNKTIWDKLIGK